MGKVKSDVVTQFKGMLKATRLGLVTSRHKLDTPSDIRNMLVDEFGFLWMPPEADHVFSTTLAGMRVKKIAHTQGIGVVFAADDKMYQDTDNFPPDIIDPPYTLTEQFTFATTEAASLEAKKAPWVVGFDGGSGGVTIQGMAGNQNETWKREGGVWSRITTAGFPHGTDSVTYKGRRFVADTDGRRSVSYSELNQPDTFLETSKFYLEGDAGGGSELEEYTGHVVGFSLWEDMLVILASQSIWILTGTDPETFRLRKTASDVGCLAINSVVEVNGGLLFFGGIPGGTMGVYFWSGNDSRLVSDDISWFFREWDAGAYEAVPAGVDQVNRNKVEDDSEWYFNALAWQGYYVFCAPTIDGTHIIFVYNTKTRAWSSFTGWGPFPRMGLEKKYYNPYALLIDNDGTLYRATRGFPRKAGEVATVSLGAYDENNPTGLMRVIALKISGHKAGSGTPTLQVTATNADGGSVVGAPVNLTDDVFDGIVLPINLRGHDIELTLTITPTQADDEVVLEQIQLISSRKGEKVSRA